MKAHLFKTLSILGLLCVILALILIPVPPVLAAAPPLEEQTWTSTMLCAPGHCGGGYEYDSHTFDAPPGAVEAAVEVWWVWTGNPGQIQKNEIFYTSVGIECNDPGDEIPPQKCGETQFAQSDNLEVTVTHGGYVSGPYGQTAGSVYAKVIVRWYGNPYPSCDQLTLIPDNSRLMVKANIKQTNAQFARIDWDNGEIKPLPPGEFSAKHRYTQPGRYNLTAWVKDSAGEWITSGACTGEVEILPKPGYVRATKIDQDGQPWSGVTVNLYRADNTFVESQETPASFGPLDLGDYYIEEEVPAGSEPISATRFDFTIDEEHPDFEAQFQNKRPCMILIVSPTNGIAPLNVKAITDVGEFDRIDWGDGSEQELVEGRSTADQAAEHIYTEPGQYNLRARVVTDGNITTQACGQVLVEKRSTPPTGQYQGFTGPVSFGTFTPYLEPGKEYFDSTRSVMFNVEYIAEDGQSDLVFRFNGQEMPGITTSIFNAGTFHQIESFDDRAVTILDEGVTKLIAYQYGAEQARIFQTIHPSYTRWIHPLDQPFEHKYEFALELYGPPDQTDLLIYGDEQRYIQYDQNGLALVNLTYGLPGLVAVYQPADGVNEPAWVTVDTVTYPVTAGQTVDYSFDETGLYHYRIVDSSGRIIAGSSSNPNLSFKVEPGQTYQAQLAYPDTSLFVGLYDDMKFKHPDFWLMPIDGRYEHDFEFHLDYHRLPDPDLGNDHIRGDVVVDGLTLSYGTTSVAQQFPYGRHDGVQPGVNLVGIPNVSMVAFCQRPGFHEVVYWGGWENESYYLPDRAWIFDQELADKWNQDQRGDCIDAARRVNMELARQGLRTDHTFRHHGERSQGYQMAQQHIWSPYNLAGMRPPHIGQFLKPGTVLRYYEDPEDILFWGWDLNKGGLADGIGAYELQKYVASLGPAQYVDMTGLHSPEDVYVPEVPAPKPISTPLPASSTPEPPAPEQLIPSPTPPMSTPEPPPPTLEPPILEPQPPSEQFPPT